jgi:hypothetical protein
MMQTLSRSIGERGDEWEEFPRESLLMPLSFCFAPFLVQVMDSEPQPITESTWPKERLTQDCQGADATLEMNAFTEYDFNFC